MRSVDRKQNSQPIANALGFADGMPALDGLGVRRIHAALCPRQGGKSTKWISWSQKTSNHGCLSNANRGRHRFPNLFSPSRTRSRRRMRFKFPSHCLSRTSIALPLTGQPSSLRGRCCRNCPRRRTWVGKNAEYAEIALKARSKH